MFCALGCVGLFSGPTKEQKAHQIQGNWPVGCSRSLLWDIWGQRWERNQETSQILLGE